tara:strand:+ start:1084 stop:1335 length:252 start_codon:yes stop_codon:yes gene_type:complete
MKDEVKYRIREYCGAFEIQIYGYKEKGMFWWKRKEWSWYRTNAWGGVIQTYPILQPFSKSFKTLEAAQKRVEEWKKGATYHCA